MIEIKVTIEEEDSGGVAVSTKSMAVGTGKETLFAVAIIESIRKAAADISGVEPEMRRNFSKIARLGEG